MRIIAVCLAAVLLSGCYESNSMLLDTKLAQQPVKHHLDWKYAADEDTYHARLVPRPDGWYDYAEAEVNSDGSEGSWERRPVLLNLLRKDKTADVYMLGTWDEQEKAYLYGLVVVKPDGQWRIVMPNCDQFSARGNWSEQDRAAAWSSGSTMQCQFSNAFALRSAMNKLVNGAGFWQRAESP